MTDEHKEEPKTEQPKPAKKENLEGIVNQTVFEKFGSGMLSGFKTVTKPFYTAGWMGGGGLLAYSVAGLGPVVFSASLATGRYFINRKIGKKFTFNDFKREYLKGLITGTAVYPLNLNIANTTGMVEKAVKFLTLTAPSFMTMDHFTDYYIDKYQTPSNLLKAAGSEGVAKVFTDGLGYSLKELPRTYKTWMINPPLLVPALATLNWTSSFSMPMKYGIASVTSTGYRYFTSRDVANNKNGNNAKQAAQPNPTQEQQQALQQYLAQNPQAAQQYRNAA